MVYANPYLACNECGCRTTDMDDGARNLPCGHTGGFESLCQSWSPVDGCSCAGVLDYLHNPFPHTCEPPPIYVPTLG